MNKTFKWVRYHVIFPFISYFPCRVAYKIAGIIGLLDSRDKTERACVVSGLKTFEIEKTGNLSLDSEVKKYFTMLAMDTLDCFLMPKFKQKHVDEIIRIKNLEVVTEATAFGGGVILLISHYGRFFMLAPALGSKGIEFGVLTTRVDAGHPSYDVIDRWYMNRKIKNALKWMEGSWITTADDPRKIYKCLNRGEMILIAIDGNETNSTKRIKYPFCGGVLDLPEGVVRIAKRTGARLVYAVTRGRKHGVEIEFYPLPQIPQKALNKSVELLEADMLSSPGHWWFWPGLSSLWSRNENREETK